MHSLQTLELGPTPLTHRQGCPCALLEGGIHSLAGEGVEGGPNSDEGTDTVLLKVYKYFMTTTVPTVSTTAQVCVQWP
jgi:hypothetical protein